MMRSIVFSNCAKSDFATAYQWYHKQNKRAAKGFEQAIDQAVMQVKASPETWSRYDEDHHFHVVEKYPYHLIYFFDERVITIVAVAHGAREPDYWQK